MSVKRVPVQPIENARKGLRPHRTLEEIKAEQGPRPKMTYEEFRAITDTIDWGDITLEDMLNALD